MKFLFGEGKIAATVHHIYTLDLAGNVYSCSRIGHSGLVTKSASEFRHLTRLGSGNVKVYADTQHWKDSVWVLSSKGTLWAIDYTSLPSRKRTYLQYKEPISHDKLFPSRKGLFGINLQNQEIEWFTLDKRTASTGSQKKVIQCEKIRLDARYARLKKIIQVKVSLEKIFILATNELSGENKVLYIYSLSEKKLVKKPYGNIEEIISEPREPLFERQGLIALIKDSSLLFECFYATDEKKEIGRNKAEMRCIGRTYLECQHFKRLLLYEQNITSLENRYFIQNIDDGGGLCPTKVVGRQCLIQEFTVSPLVFFLKDTGIVECYEPTQGDMKPELSRVVVMQASFFTEKDIAEKTLVKEDLRQRTEFLHTSVDVKRTRIPTGTFASLFHKWGR